MSSEREVFSGDPPVVLHLPNAATKAELVHKDGLWMVFYRPGGAFDQIDGAALGAELCDDVTTGSVVDYIEKRLRAAGRNPVRITIDLPLAIVAVWTLAFTEQAA